MIAEPPTFILRRGIDAIAAVTALVADADERQVIVSRIASGVRSVHEAKPGYVLLRVVVDVDTLQALETAAEVALPEPTHI